MATTSVSASALKGYAGLGSSFASGENHGLLVKSVKGQARIPKPGVRARPMMSINEGKGLFAPIVVVAKNVIGQKRFNQIRGKAIALHSQVITEFCKTIGADAKQRQGLIRLAKKNGEKLGFLA
uniref:PGR5 n=1 Tax=Portulaca oleracea TaxID=46147 RepID=Q4R1B2_POROL|nr:PGR5 [Portulaca oleracea]